MITAELRRILKTKVLLSENKNDLLEHITRIKVKLESNDEMRLERSELDKILTKTYEIYETIMDCDYNTKKEIL